MHSPANSTHGLSTALLYESDDQFSSVKLDKISDVFHKLQKVQKAIIDASYAAAAEVNNTANEYLPESNHTKEANKQLAPSRCVSIANSHMHAQLQ